MACDSKNPVNTFSVALPWASEAIIQRDIATTISGYAEASLPVTLFLDEIEIGQVKADDNGYWSVPLSAQEAGGPHSLNVQNSDGKKISFADIWFGDVWLISGQSNMEWKLGWGVDGGNESMENTNEPLIRVLDIPNSFNEKAQSTLPKKPLWKKAIPENMANFSAIGFYFAKLNRAEIKVPIGIIDVTWGGTPAEAWTPLQTLTMLPFYADKANEYLDPAKDWKEEMATNDALTKANNAMINSPELGLAKMAHLSTYDDSNWEEISFPSSKKLTEAVWFRKILNLQNTPKDSVVLETGNVSQEAFYYLNGKEIGRKSWQMTKERFIIDPKLFREGENLLAFRVVNSWDNAVRVASEEPMSLSIASENTIEINANWKMNNEVEPAVPQYKRYEFEPGFLFNAMIVPLKNASFKGVLWYQGESNVIHYNEYEALFAGMISSWRTYFEKPEMPFYFAQLAAYQKAKDTPSDDDWVRLQEAQSKVNTSVENTQMIVLNDIGDADDIHPRNKKEAARRFWLQVQKNSYRKDIVAGGPIYKNHQIEGSSILINFNSAAEGVKSRDGGALKGFAIAGENGKFEWASTVKILDNNTIEVAHDTILKPVAVRYAWAANPTTANLVNSEGLPASAFRTDDWP